DPTHADRAQRVAVIGLLERDEAQLAGAAAMMKVLIGHLQGDLDRGRSAVRVEDLGEAGRGDPDETLGQLRGRWAGQAEQGSVGHPVELAANGVVDLGAAVVVNRHPQRGDAIEVATADLVEEVVALGALDDQRFVADPVAHLRKGMPDVLPIEICDGAHGKRPRMSASAASARSMSGSVWPLDRAKRRRAGPRGTVGGRMPCAKMPRSSKASHACMAAVASPMTMGTICDQRPRGAGSPSAARPSANRVATCWSWARRAVPSAPAASVTAAWEAAATAGGRAVVKTKLRAHWVRYSTRAAEPAT